MTRIKIAYFAFRCKSLPSSLKFYTAIGMTFKQEQHGQGPVHWAAELAEGMVMELYPIQVILPTDVIDRYGKVRIGIECHIGRALDELKKLGVQPEINHGRVCATDPDGRTVELLTAS